MMIHLDSCHIKTDILQYTSGDIPSVYIYFFNKQCNVNKNKINM